MLRTHREANGPIASPSIQSSITPFALLASGVGVPGVDELHAFLSAWVYLPTTSTYPGVGNP